MIKKTTTEANQGFTNITKIVDEEGAVLLTKHGKGRYVIMTIEKFENKTKFENEMKEKANNGFWFKYRNNYWHIKNNRGTITLTRLEYVDNELDYFKIITLPEDSVSYEEPNIINIEKKGKINIIAEEARYNKNKAIEKLAEEIVDITDFPEIELTGFRMAVI